MSLCVKSRFFWHMQAMLVGRRSSHHKWLEIKPGSDSCNYTTSQMLLDTPIWHTEAKSIPTTGENPN